MNIPRECGEMEREIRVEETTWEGTEKRLTWRETTVLELLANGKSNKEIARTLFISAETVKTHVSHILRKLGVQSRIDAAIWWKVRELGGR